MPDDKKPPTAPDAEASELADLEPLSEEASPAAASGGKELPELPEDAHHHDELHELEELEPHVDPPPAAPVEDDLLAGDADLLELDDAPGDAGAEGLGAALEDEDDRPRVETSSARRRRAEAANENAAAEAAAALAAHQAQAGTSTQAPLLLKKAAVVVAVGSLLPWLATEASLAVTYGSKIAILAAAYLFHVCVLARAGEKVDPSFAKLANKHFVDIEKRPKNLLDQFLHAFWSPLHIIALVLLVGGIALNAIAGEGMNKAFAEAGMLAWAAITFVHIDAYERGHRFNPIFPLMFLGHAVAGLLGFTTQLALEDKNPLAMLGALIVAVGGFFAMYTMFVAMKQAKVEGDLKKKAALEARKAARRQRSGS